MAAKTWPIRQKSVATLHLDSKNPRLGRETSSRAPREIVQYLFDHDKAFDVAQSIVSRGYFANEPLLAVTESARIVVVEGNRRLAALKALKEPGLLTGPYQRKVERLARQIEDPESVSSVPVVLAPSRRATDRLIAGRHVGTPVLPWQAENRASFILEKLSEGYTNSQLRDQLGFTEADIQAARQTRAIAEMARSLDLSDEIKAKIESPRTNLFTTIERVFDSTVGREYLQIEPDAEHGIRGRTTKAEFLRGFTRLVTDIALGKQSSRTLNKNEDIKSYFDSLPASERPTQKRGSFVPSDIITGRSVASSARHKDHQEAELKHPKRESKTVVPRDFAVRAGNDRLKDIRRELVKLKRDDFPNAGAVLLRVFLELSIVDYLERTGRLVELIRRIEEKEHRKIPYGTPTLRQLTPTITEIAKAELSRTDAAMVEKSLRYDPAAPFSISELHSFVHQQDFPSARDIFQFWKRIEPLMRLMLEKD
jgi:hypothetical protein